MAGAFGYGADTIDVSLAMGELSLLPAVRKAEADTLIVADGTSCRHQIDDGAQREALHVARVLAMSVAAASACKARCVDHLPARHRHQRLHVADRVRPHRGDVLDSTARSRACPPRSSRAPSPPITRALLMV